MIPIDVAYEAIHRKNVDKYSKRLKVWYNSYIKEITEYAASKGGNFTPGESLPSSIQNKLKELSKAMIGEVEGLIVEGVNSSWDTAVEKNNAIATKIYGTSMDKLPKEYREKYLSNNGVARDAFLKRKEDGLGLSDRVWNNSTQFRQELEMGLELGLLDGKSAQAMARDLKQYLNDPDKLFRRVRDEFGELRLSKAAAAYHPGQGRYRSSYKNALRLTRNEINFSYEKSQFLKRQQQDFIVGIEIKVSQSHDPSDDKGGISCFGLQGKYPKEFEFTNKWHVNCKCQSFHILKTPDELDEDLGLILDGKQPLKTSANKIDILPQQYKSYLDSISEKDKDWKGKQRTFSINDKLMKLKLEPIKPQSNKVYTSQELKKELESKLGTLDSKLKGFKLQDVALSDPDLQLILEKGELMLGKGKMEMFMAEGECHWNVAELYRKGDIDSIVIGYTYNPYNPKLMIQHTWGLKNGIVVETTASNAYNGKYYGYILNEDQAKSFSRQAIIDLPGMGKMRQAKSNLYNSIPPEFLLRILKR